MSEEPGREEGGGPSAGNDRSRRKFLRDLAVLPAAGVTAGLLTWREVSSGGGQTGGPRTADFDQWSATTMTTRLAGANDYETAAAFSQNVYTAINEPTKPGAVILANDSVLEAALPSVPVIHHPIDGAVLLTRQDSLPEATRRELERLHPEGVRLDRNVQVYLVGGERYISESVRREVESMGLSTRRIGGETPPEVAARVDQYVSAMHGNHEDEVMIADLQEPLNAIAAQSWNAHAGNGFLYVDGGTIPRETRDQLESRWGGAYMYLLGTEEQIPPNVARDLASYGHVQRIPNAGTPYSFSVGFAGYKDVGRNFGWWLGEWPRNFGWGIAEAGHNFIVANPDAWQTAIPASVESHRGKHGPMLLVQQDDVPTPVANYLSNLVEPHESAPYDRKYNHAWIVGRPSQVSTGVQAELHAILGGTGSGSP